MNVSIRVDTRVSRSTLLSPSNIEFDLCVDFTFSAKASVTLSWLEVRAGWTKDTGDRVAVKVAEVALTLAELGDAQIAANLVSSVIGNSTRLLEQLRHDPMSMSKHGNDVELSGLRQINLEPRIAEAKRPA